MTKMNKVLLYVGVIAAITGMPSCYAAQNLGAGDMFDQLSVEQQKQFARDAYKKLKSDKELRLDLALQVLKHLPQKTKNLALEPVKQLLDGQLQNNFKKALLEDNKEEAVKIINVMRNRDANRLQEMLNEAILHASTVESVTLLIEVGAAVNAKNKYGETPLHVAARYNSKDVAKILIQNQAAVNAKDKHGNTPLQLAEIYHNVDMIKLLLAHGAKE